jgi:hypothetical protein
MTLALVIGMGEVGKPLFKLLSAHYGRFEVKSRDLGPVAWKDTFQYLHICFPQTQNFLEAVADYVVEYSAPNVIIHSTLSPGMTEYLEARLLDANRSSVFYSPVRANVRDGMIWGMKTYTKYLAPAKRTGMLNLEAVVQAKEHLEGAGMSVKIVEDATSLEYAKLFNLAYYGVCIALFQEFERIVEEGAALTPACAQKGKLDYRVIRDFIGSTGEEAKKGGKDVPRPLYYGGFIGGHCIIPALEKLVAAHEIPLFEAVLESNIKRGRELLFRIPAHVFTRDTPSVEDAPE